MSNVRQGPPRTRAVAALDLAQEAVSRVGLARHKLVTGARGNQLMMRGLVVAAIAVVVGTALVVTALVRAPDRLAPMGVEPRPAPAASTPGTEPGTAGLGPGSADPTATAGAVDQPAPAPGTTTARPSTGEPPAAVPLTAEYATEEPSLLGYRGVVAIVNPGPVAAPGWTVVITLPRRTLLVGEVTGARASQDGANWTFTPEPGAAGISPGGTVRFGFRVSGAALGATTPTACTIDGRPCGGDLPTPAP
nr:cellulose binding domain-containing protein [Micromonospora sp. DSM 115978]